MRFRVGTGVRFAVRFGAIIVVRVGLRFWLELG